MVAGPEEHESAGAHHRFELGPDFFDRLACGQRLVRALAELPQLLLERSRNLIEWSIGQHSNVLDDKASGIDRVAALGCHSTLAVIKVAADSNRRQCGRKQYVKDFHVFILTADGVTSAQRQSVPARKRLAR